MVKDYARPFIFCFNGKIVISSIILITFKGDKTAEVTYFYNKMTGIVKFCSFVADINQMTWQFRKR
jgi:hypothetical protein